MRKTAIIGGLCVAAGILTASPAWAGSAVVSPTPAQAGSAITITITCSVPTASVTFPGDPAVFQGGGALGPTPQGALPFILNNGLADGNYPEVFTCISFGLPPEEPIPLFEQITALVVVGPKPSVTPSGAPSTGGGGFQAKGSKTLGLGAIALAGVIGSAMFFARRRREA
jgi:hypothetical protein